MANVFFRGDEVVSKQIDTAMNQAEANKEQSVFKILDKLGVLAVEDAISSFNTDGTPQSWQGCFLAKAAGRELEGYEDAAETLGIRVDQAERIVHMYDSDNRRKELQVIVSKWLTQQYAKQKESKKNDSNMAEAERRDESPICDGLGQSVRSVT